jgi:hypothetical protein
MNKDLLQQANDVLLEIETYGCDISGAGKLIKLLVAKINELQLALIDSRAEYLNTLDKNPTCSAWTLDELSPKEQTELRKQACKSLEMEEPLILYDLEHKDDEINKLRVANIIKNLKYIKWLDKERKKEYGMSHRHEHAQWKRE